MRKQAFLIVVALAVACASRPQKLAGTYAIVVDPGAERMSTSVVSALTSQLNLAASPAEADAVIILRRGTTDAHLVYEIRRGDEIIVSTDPGNGMNLRNDVRSIKGDLEWDRREEAAQQGDPYRMNEEELQPSSASTSDMAMLSAKRTRVRRVTDMIVYDLRTKL